MSSSQAKARLADGPSVVQLGQLRSRHRSCGLDGQWTTIAVLGEASDRDAASGRSYSIWKLTDLDQACISLFLFGAAHDDFRRQPVGTMVALFSPKVGQAASLAGYGRHTIHT